MMQSVPDGPTPVADILLPLPVQSTFTYRLPPALERTPEVGRRALVPFGKHKMHAGVIVRLYTVSDYETLKGLKLVEEILDDRPVVTQALLALYRWMAHYYMCSAGEVLKASLPLGMKVDSEKVVELGPEVDLDDPDISDREYLVLEALSLHPELTYEDIGEILGLKRPETCIQQMETKGYVTVRGRARHHYRPRTVRCVALTEAYHHPDSLREAFARLEQAPRQAEALMLITEAHYRKQTLAERDILQRLKASASVLQGLKTRGIIQVEEVAVDRLTTPTDPPTRPPVVLTDSQQTALAQLRTALEAEPRKPVLLHGVTGSGKTHLYIELIRDVLARGQQALYLLPEIALTKQIIDKVTAEFGEGVGVYHSRFNAGERVETWQKILDGHYQVVIGVRSAVLLPFPKLGLIVVDEEHDGSFKQYDPAPRYHARDVAIYYGHRLGIPVVLGSATPALETYYNTLQDRYRRVDLPERVQQRPLPEVKLVNMRTQTEHQLSYGLYSDVLIEELKTTLARGEQAIVFHNRRGYSPYLQCGHCGHVPHCRHCDISLTYHKASDYLRCHYCGYTDYSTRQCRACRHQELGREGIGTERLEEHLRELFPEAGIARLDLDTARGKNALPRLIQAFESREVDVLVGTQMVTKGLDFENVTLVAVVMADRLFNFPDFRAHETAYQLLTQFSGRAGRSHKPGRVLIQTRNPEHPVLTLLGQPYTTFYNRMVEQREAPRYPPFVRLIRLELQHRDRAALHREAQVLAARIRPAFGHLMLGPEPPMVERIRNTYRQHLLLKVEKGISPEKLRTWLRNEIDAYYEAAANRTLRIVVDVDPR